MIKFLIRIFKRKNKIDKWNFYNPDLKKLEDELMKKGSVTNE